MEIQKFEFIKMNTKMAQNLGHNTIMQWSDYQIYELGNFRSWLWKAKERPFLKLKITQSFHL